MKQLLEFLTQAMKFINQLATVTGFIVLLALTGLGVWTVKEWDRVSEVSLVKYWKLANREAQIEQTDAMQKLIQKDLDEREFELKRLAAKVAKKQ